MRAHFSHFLRRTQRGAPVPVAARANQRRSVPFLRLLSARKRGAPLKAWPSRQRELHQLHSLFIYLFIRERGCGAGAREVTCRKRRCAPKSCNAHAELRRPTTPLPPTHNPSLRAHTSHRTPPRAATAASICEFVLTRASALCPRASRRLGQLLSPSLRCPLSPGRPAKTQRQSSFAPHTSPAGPRAAASCRSQLPQCASVGTLIHPAAGSS